MSHKIITNVSILDTLNNLHVDEEFETLKEMHRAVTEAGIEPIKSLDEIIKNFYEKDDSGDICLLYDNWINLKLQNTATFEELIVGTIRGDKNSIETLAAIESKYYVSIGTPLYDLRTILPAIGDMKKQYDEVQQKRDEMKEMEPTYGR